MDKISFAERYVREEYITLWIEENINFLLNSFDAYTKFYFSVHLLLRS